MTCASQGLAVHFKGEEAEGDLTYLVDEFGVLGIVDVSREGDVVDGPADAERWRSATILPRHSLAHFELGHTHSRR
jgi:hypothetical protein